MNFSNYPFIHFLTFWGFVSNYRGKPLISSKFYGFRKNLKIWSISKKNLKSGKKTMSWTYVRIGDPPVPTVYTLVHSPKYIPNGVQQRGGIVGAIWTGFVLNYRWKLDVKPINFESWIPKYCLCLGSAMGESDHVILTRDSLHLKWPASFLLFNGYQNY